MLESCGMCGGTGSPKSMSSPLLICKQCVLILSLGKAVLETQTIIEHAYDCPQTECSLYKCNCGWAEIMGKIQSIRNLQQEEAGEHDCSEISNS